MHRDLHPRSSVDRLYIPRAQGGRGLLSVKDSVELERSILFDYAANNNERLPKAARLLESYNQEQRLMGRIKKNKRMKDRYHGKESIVWSTPDRNRGDARSKEVAVAEVGELKRETESLICTVQEQALRTNDIDQQDVSRLCRLCTEKVESVTHFVS